MASRFWVAGGSGTWNSTDTNNWSATSGGASGASVPGTNDDVFFDANSGAGTATKANTGLTISSLDMTGSTATIAWSNRTMVISGGSGTGNVTLVAAKCSGTVSFTFNGTIDQTFDPNGYTSIVDVNRQGGSGTTQKLSFLSGCTASGTLQLNRAKLDLNGQNVTFATFSSSNSTTREFIWGSGTLTLTNSWDTTTATNFTLTTSATSALVGSGALNITTGTALTFPDTTLNHSAIGGTFTVSSALTFTSLKITRTLNVTVTLQIAANFTVTNLFSIPQVNETGATSVKSDTGGTPRTITASGGFWNRGSVSFQDITAAGITPWVARDGSSDVSGNTNIVFSGHSKNNNLAEMGVGM